MAQQGQVRALLILARSSVPPLRCLAPWPAGLAITAAMTP